MWFSAIAFVIMSVLLSTTWPRMAAVLTRISAVGIGFVVGQSGEAGETMPGEAIREADLTSLRWWRRAEPKEYSEMVPRRSSWRMVANTMWCVRSGERYLHRFKITDFAHEGARLIRPSREIGGRSHNGSYPHPDFAL